MKKVSLLLGMIMMISVSVFAQDRASADEQAQVLVEEFMSQTEINEDQQSQLMNTVAGVIHKAEYLRSSENEDMDEDTREQAMKELHNHLVNRSEAIFDEDQKRESFMQFAEDHIELR